MSDYWIELLNRLILVLPAFLSGYLLGRMKND